MWTLLLVSTTSNRLQAPEHGDLHVVLKNYIILARRNRVFGLNYLRVFGAFRPERLARTSVLASISKLRNIPTNTATAN